MQALTGSHWFYLLDLFGTAAFAASGVIRAHKGRYDIFGAFVLAFLPAVGGGTLRDVLIGGDRSPPFVFRDPIYVELVLGVVVLGTIASRRWRVSESAENRLSMVLEICDAMGLACFTVIGAKVALAAKLHWIWAPLFAALTCAGGGVMRDLVCGREPGTLKGEIYEELAFFGGLLFTGIVFGAQIWAHAAATLVVATMFVMIAVFAARVWVVTKGVTSPTLGTVPPS
ncbi:MAG: trimeric intracellular cation channel family protein [Polyangiales bacterium]